MPRSLLLTYALLASAAFLAAQTSHPDGVVGTWRTPGGATVRVAPCGSDLCATLIQLEPNAPTLDEKNPDPARRSQKLCGKQIGYGFRLTDPTHAEDGHLYDPKSGKTYKGAMTSNGDALDLRGYIGIKAFGRSEHWTRTSGQATCS